MLRNKEYDIANRLSLYEMADGEAISFTPKEALYLQKQGNTLFKLNKKAAQDHHIAGSILNDELRKRRDEMVQPLKAAGFSDKNKFVEPVKAGSDSMIKSGFLGFTSALTLGVADKPFDMMLGEKTMDALRTAKGIRNPYAIGEFGGSVIGMLGLASLFKQHAPRVPGFAAYASRMAASPIGKSVLGSKYASWLPAAMKGSASMVPAATVYEVAPKVVDDIYKGRGINVGQVIQSTAWSLLKESLLFAATGGLFNSLKLRPGFERAKNLLFGTTSRLPSTALFAAGGGTIGAAGGAAYGVGESILSEDRDLVESVLERSGQGFKGGALVGGGSALLRSYILKDDPKRLSRIFQSVKRGVGAFSDRTADAIKKAELLGFSTQDIDRLASIIGRTRKGADLPFNEYKMKLVNSINKTVDRAVDGINVMRADAGLPPKQLDQFKVHQIYKFVERRARDLRNTHKDLMKGLEDDYKGMVGGLPRLTHGKFKDDLFTGIQAATNLKTLVKQGVYKDTMNMFNKIVNPVINKEGLKFAPRHIEAFNTRLGKTYDDIVKSIEKTKDSVLDAGKKKQLGISMLKFTGQKISAKHIFKAIEEQAAKRHFQNEDEVIKFTKKFITRRFKNYFKGSKGLTIPRAHPPHKFIEDVTQGVAKDIIDVLKKDAGMRKMIFKAHKAPLQTKSSSLSLKQLNQLIGAVGSKIDDAGLQDARATGSTHLNSGYKFMYKKLIELRSNMIAQDFGKKGIRDLKKFRSIDTELLTDSVFLSAAKAKGINVSKELDGIMDNSLLRYRLGRETVGGIGGMVTYLFGGKYKGSLRLGGDDFIRLTFMDRVKRYMSGVEPSLSFNVDPEFTPVPRNFVTDSVSLIKDTADNINQRYLTFETINQYLSQKTLRRTRATLLTLDDSDEPYETSEQVRFKREYGL